MSRTCPLTEIFRLEDVSSPLTLFSNKSNINVGIRDFDGPNFISFCQTNFDGPPVYSRRYKQGGKGM